MHNTTTRRAVLQQAVSRLEAAGVEHARRNAEWLLLAVVGGNRAGLFAHADAPLSADERARFDALVARRADREPLQYVLGETDFYGLTLHVTPAVLIPRPETEEVVEAALAAVADVDAPRVLDVGTGSGCIPLAVRHKRPDAMVTACDISDAALAVARANAERLGLPVAFDRADVLADDFADHVPAPFDLVISNPPYVPPSEADTLAPEVVAHEPHLALFSDADPLQFYRALARHAARLLAPGGRLVLETHADHGNAVRDLLTAHGLAAAELRHDLAGRPRIALARRAE